MMPHIRHTAVLCDAQGNEVGELTAYTETPYDEDDYVTWPPEARASWADSEHHDWASHSIVHYWEHAE